MHELAHIIVYVALGRKPQAVTLAIEGIRLKANERYLSPRKEAFALSAGCFVNLSMFVLLSFFPQSEETTVDVYKRQMHYHHGYSVCISTQVGCQMGCSFCASTIAGFVRHLTPSELLDQIYAVQKDSGQKVSNVVLMGIGEPLDNYDNVVKFLRLLSSPEGINLSLRHVSLSTLSLIHI